MDRRVRAELLGEFVPLDATAQSIDDPIKDGSKRGAWPSGFRRRVELEQDLFERWPKGIGDVPDSVGFIFLCHGSGSSGAITSVYTTAPGAIKRLLG